jgi:NTP pyrophosphatase (non-canonical NTP hydrolase)
MNLREMQEMQSGFDKEHASLKEFFVPITDSNTDELQFLVVCLSGEVGELANLAKKISRGDFRVADVRSDIEDEAADILIYLLKLSTQLGFDLETAFRKKLVANRRRFRKHRK